MEMEESKEATAACAPSPDPVITVHVKFGGRTISVSLSPESTGKDLKSLLQPLTNVLPRGQKLIFKGKVIADSLNLKLLQISDGSKIMLIASQGLHQGEGPTTKDAAASAVFNLKKDYRSHQNQIHNSIERIQSERWKLTGVAALSDLFLKVVPDEVWECGPSIRVLDISNNSIQDLPANIGFLKSLNKLYLNANDLSDEKINWEGLAQLKSLRILSINQNKISSVSTSIGNCFSLVEIDLSSNLLTELPETFGKLQNLKALHLRNNGLKSLPSTLFKLCKHLSILDLHCTEITNDCLRKIEGWEDFDMRRRLKHQKQLDFHVGSSGAFDEGADDDNKY